MKGLSFQAPLELSLRLDGESWRQGDRIAGELQIKNRGTQTASLTELRVILAEGTIKKVHAKAANAFDVIERLKLGEGKILSADETLNFPITFQLDVNSPITDVSYSPFMLYGAGTDEKMGVLQLPVAPHLVAQELIERLKVAFRFVHKHSKSRKKGVESKMIPPDGRNFQAVEHLMIDTRMDGEDLVISYEFAIKKIEGAPASAEKKKVGTEDRITAADYRLPSGRFNHDKLEASLRKALDLVESKVVFT